MRRKGVLWIIIFLIIVIFLISEFFLPQFAVNKLRFLFEQETKSIDKLDINIASFPALKILTGRIDHVIIKSEGLMLDNLYLKTFNIRYCDILFRKNSFTGINTHLEAVISESAINDYIKTKYPELEDFHLQITPEQVLLQGSISFFEADINLKLSGNFVINEKQEIYFIPDDFQIENIQIPVDLLKNYIEKIDFSFSLEELDIPLDISEIKLMSGYLVISGGVSEKGGEI